MSRLNIGIAGAGIMGLTLAWRLARNGHRVTVLEADADPQTRSGAVWTAAGMLTPNTEVDAPADLVEQGRHSLALWPGLIDTLNRALPEALHCEIGSGGCWVVAHRGDRGAWEIFRRQLRALPGSGDQGLREYHGRDLAAANPTLGHFGEGLFLPGEARVDPGRVMAALDGALQRNGATLRRAEPVAALEPGRLRGPGGWQSFDQVVDCRGLGARDAVTNLRGVRGETVLVEAPEVTLDTLVRLIHPRYPLYIVPRGGHRYVIGATQIESEDRGPMRLRSAMELLSAAYTVHPGFAEARVLALQANCRPALPDHRPLLDNRAGLTRINGLYRHGILLAPLLAEQACAAIETATSEIADETSD